MRSSRSGRLCFAMWSFADSEQLPEERQPRPVPARGCSLRHQQQLGEPWKDHSGVKIQGNPSPPSIAEAQPSRGEARLWTVAQPRTGPTLRCSPWMPRRSSAVGSAAPEVIKSHSIPSCCEGFQGDAASAISSANLLWFESGNNGGRLPRARNPATGSSWLLSVSKMQPDTKGSTEVK